MKTTVLILLFGLLMSGITFSQHDKKVNKYKVVDIKASMTCNDCKENIEKNIAFEKGVKDLDVNLDTKIVTIKYDTQKTNPEKLQKAIQDLKYTAEIVKVYDFEKEDSKSQCCDKSKKSETKCCHKKEEKSDKCCEHDKKE